MLEDTIINFIGSYGFPIIAYLLLFFKMDKSINKLESTLTKYVEQNNENMQLGNKKS